MGSRQLNARLERLDCISRKSKKVIVLNALYLNDWYDMVIFFVYLLLFFL